MLLLNFKKFGNTERKIYDLVKPITDELEYFLWDISFVKEGAVWYLRVFIDRDEGISIQSVCAGWCSGYNPQSPLQNIELCAGNQGWQQVHGVWRL